MTTTDDQDRSLVARAQQGDFEAFDSLVNKYGHRVYSLAIRIVGRRHDAEEIVQQTFLSLVQHLKDFREESLFSTWLTRIATNHALALLRKQSHRRTVPLGEDFTEGGDDGSPPRPEYIAEWRETPEQIAARHETRRLLDEALAKLDEKYRLVFLLRDVEELSTKETADLLGISVSNVKVRLLRARLMLREHLTRLFGDEATRVLPGEHR
jgi:RNA polymerase sigma-70 factor (ECF subfamily)